MIWRRDGTHTLRGGCSHCPTTRCTNYERLRRAPSKRCLPLDGNVFHLFGASALTDTLCVCGHASADHTPIHERGMHTKKDVNGYTE